MGRRKILFPGPLSLRRSIFLLALMVIVSGCGKKGPPTLKSFEKPAAPTGLTAIHREDVVHLLWNFPKDREITVRNFVILRSSGTEFKTIAEAESNKRSFSDKDASKGTAYTYKVLAQNHRGTLSNDSNLLAVKPEAVPLPPSAVKFMATDNSVQLQWQAQSEGTLFNVYKSHEKGVYGLMPLNNAPFPATSFTDTFDLKKTVYYTIRSLSDISIRNESGPSPETEVNPLEFVPSQPAGLRYFVSDERIYLSWDGPVEAWVTGFRVYKRTKGGDYRFEADTQIPAYIDNDRSEGDRDYRIHSVGPLREGPGAEITGVIFGRGR